MVVADLDIFLCNGRLFDVVFLVVISDRFQIEIFHILLTLT